MVGEFIQRIEELLPWTNGFAWGTFWFVEQEISLIMRVCAISREILAFLLSKYGQAFNAHSFPIKPIIYHYLPHKRVNGPARPIKSSHLISQKVMVNLARCSKRLFSLP